MARVVRVPVKRLTPEAAEGFGRVIRSLDEIEPIIRKGEMVKERMEVRRQGDELYFKNYAVDDEGVVAKLVGRRSPRQLRQFSQRRHPSFHRCQSQTDRVPSSETHQEPAPRGLRRVLLRWLVGDEHVPRRLAYVSASGRGKSGIREHAREPVPSRDRRP